jgi:hypothetical protein
MAETAFVAAASFAGLKFSRPGRNFGCPASTESWGYVVNLSADGNEV